MKRTTRQPDLPAPVEAPLIPILAALRNSGKVEPDLRRFRFGDCDCLVGSSFLGWHLSVSCRERYPTWDELAHAREHLLPMDATFALIFPPPAEYVNRDPNRFHLWQVQPSRGRPILVPGMVVDARGNSIPEELLTRCRGTSTGTSTA